MARTPPWHCAASLLWPSGFAGGPGGCLGRGYKQSARDKLLEPTTKVAAFVSPAAVYFIAIRDSPWRFVCQLPPRPPADCATDQPGGMSEATWRRYPTTAGRSIHSQYKPDHAKEWQATEDRRQQKAVFGEAKLDDTRGLTNYRDSLYRPTGIQPVERKHNTNVKTLAELRTLLTPADCPAPTAATHDLNEMNIGHMPKNMTLNPCDVKGTFSPAFVHQHHFGWNAPSMQRKTAHIRSDIPFARDRSLALGNLDYSNKIAGKLAAMSSRRP